MLEAYRKHVQERAAEGVPPKPLDSEQVAALVELLKSPPAGEEDFILDLLKNRVPAGVDEAAYIKAGFLAAVAKGEAESPLVSKAEATELLGTMLGGYNIEPMIQLLDDEELGPIAAKGLGVRGQTTSSTSPRKASIESGGPTGTASTSRPGDIRRTARSAARTVPPVAIPSSTRMTVRPSISGGGMSAR